MPPALQNVSVRTIRKKKKEKTPLAKGHFIRHINTNLSFPIRILLSSAASERNESSRVGFFFLFGQV